ncbi:MAG: hypothetical protein A2539_08055 [Elusimicrobia bacterium RIFOXYD2_FULL_34_15]|nr:MAG: hypothetical protein A2539_08055 [Elusimicrobia bacterium RIFOXYD2_FULL_34_15]
MNNITSLQNYAKNFFANSDVSYVIFYNENNEIVAMKGSPQFIDKKFQNDDILKLKSNTYNIYRGIIGKKGTKIGSLNIGFDMSSINKIVGRDLITNILLWLFTDIFILVIYYYLLTYFLKPLKSLHEAAKCISKKDFTCFVPVSSKDELGDISEQFNTMIGELNNFYNNLENQIKKSTEGIHILNKKLIDRSMELDTLNKQLKELDKKKSDFVSIVAHDLRTPLTSIMGYTDTILNDKLKISEQDKKEYLNIIHNESCRISRLVSDFLDVSKIEAGMIELNKEETNMAELVKETTKSINMILKGDYIVVESDKNINKIKIDNDRITQVLQNIIWNAIKFSPKGSIIKIAVKNYPDGVKVDIFDKGPGIPAKYKEKIFQKFFIIDDDILRKKTGTGLGLAIAKSIIEMHGGKIWVENVVSGGSCFSFTIPGERVNS